jgi:hypothetical protein
MFGKWATPVIICNWQSGKVAAICWLTLILSSKSKSPMNDWLPQDSEIDGTQNFCTKWV